MALGVCACAGVTAAVLFALRGSDGGPVGAAGTQNSIASPDGANSVGIDTSLVLDTSGNPVISYDGLTNGNLKVLHCDDPNCAGNESANITTPDTGGQVGQHSSIVLDSSGNPVVSYYDFTNQDLKVLHCDDPNCAGNESANINSPDTSGNVGQYTSIALNSAGNPIVSYWDVTNDDLKVLHCNDPECAPGGNTVNSPDGGADVVGQYTSLVLNPSTGNPVISYYAAVVGNLRLLHCNDPACAPGGNTITDVHISNDVGWYTSLVLDSSNFPVISYYDATNTNLRVVHCGSLACTPTSGNVYTAPDTVDVGQHTSVKLDTSGNPVVSYYGAGSQNLKILHCGNPNCTSANTITIPDSGGDVGTYTSLRLDGSGRPVVSYKDETNANLKVLHCWDATCGVKPPTATPTPTDTPTNTPTNTPTVTPTNTPTDTPTNTPTPTITPTPTPTKLAPPGDTDGDGCTDAQENGPDETLGGRRNYRNFWDFYDTPDASNMRNKVITLFGDIFGVSNRFNANDAGKTAAINRNSDPLSAPPAAPAYHPAFDRSAPLMGDDPWDLRAPDGIITLFGDIFSVTQQFNHNCN